MAYLLTWKPVWELCLNSCPHHPRVSSVSRVNTISKAQMKSIYPFLFVSTDKILIPPLFLAWTASRVSRFWLLFPANSFLKRQAEWFLLKPKIWSGYSTTQSPSMGSQSTQSTSSLPRCVLAPACSSGLVSCFSWYPHPLLIGVQMLRLRFSHVHSPFPEFCVYASLPSAFFLNLLCGCFLLRLQDSISIPSPHKDLLGPPSHYWYSVS